ncbi:MAG: flagellar protein [Phycisphaerae bacterium]|nr:flagellar protein [Phycisphaerae bacterium]|tara:strand:+ start:385 stop:582 length:198 start_codon:yes stop_codon:yes gene_type:complete
MIELTRLNGQRFVLNAEQIRTVEETPDTLITLLSGDRLVVKEKAAQVVRLVIDYGRALRRLVPLD